MSETITITWATVASRLSQLICGLSGHELVLSAEPGRLSLKCMSCPYETPGWIIKESRADARPRHQSPAVFVGQRAHG
jgi:hypothetical protein